MKLPMKIPSIKEQELTSAIMGRSFINSAVTGNVQIHIKEGDYYCEASCERRGARPDVNRGVDVYDTSTLLLDIDYSSIQNAYFEILRSQLQDQFAAFFALIEKMKTDGRLPRSTAVMGYEDFYDWFEQLNEIVKASQNSE